MKQIGIEGFFWWFGVVEDRKDPEKLGRVKVRVYNFHGSKVETPTNDLQWAFIIMQPTSAGFNKIGLSPTGIVEGSTVFGFFADGQNGQMPMILGTLQGIPDKDVNKHDVTPLARENNTINKSLIGPEPPSSYGSVYPYNKVFQSESGHVIEIDDTPNRERIHVYHKKGSYTEINQDGRRVSKIVDDNIEVVLKNKTVFVQGDCKLEVKGNCKVEVNGDYSLNVKGKISINGNEVVINNGKNGAARVNDQTDSSKILKGSSSVKIGD
ncbi:hypothetical protein EB118_02975 [bacterium]|nr:hypothetical protein [bacterium]